MGHEGYIFQTNSDFFVKQLAGNVSWIWVLRQYFKQPYYYQSLARFKTTYGINFRTSYGPRPIGGSTFIRPY